MVSDCFSCITHGRLSRQGERATGTRMYALRVQPALVCILWMESYLLFSCRIFECVAISHNEVRMVLEVISFKSQLEQYTDNIISTVSAEDKQARVRTADT